MHNILTELWCGNLAPIENSGKNDPDIDDLLLLMEKNRETLSSVLSETDKNTFLNYINCTEEYLLLSSQHAFCDGFRLACHLLTEGLS